MSRHDRRAVGFFVGPGDARSSAPVVTYETSTKLSSLDFKNTKIIQNSWDTTPSSKILAAKIDANLLMQFIFYDVMRPSLQQL